MSLGEIIGLFAAIVTVALVAVLVGSPNTAKIITAWGNTFAQALKAAMGK